MVGRPSRRRRGRAKPRGGLPAAVFCFILIAAVAVLSGRDLREVAGDLFAPNRTPVTAGLTVVDGDTLRRADGETIRLANIDTAEMPPRSRCQREEDLALAATARLRALVAQSREVSFIPDRRERDRYGRLLGRVSLDGRDVGEQLVSAGLARRWTGRRESWCAAA